MTAAQASTIEVEGDSVVFSFAGGQRFLQQQVEQARAWLEPMASTIAGRRMQVNAVLREAPAGQGSGGPSAPPDDLRATAASDPDMKALLDILPLEIKSVEKLGKDGE